MREPATTGPGNAGTAPRLYSLSGFSVRSAIALPELQPAAPLAAGTLPDLDIRFGPVPECLEEADHASAWFEARGADTLLIRAPEIGRFLVTADGTALIEPDPAAAEADIRVIVFGSVFGAFLLMRGLFPLHASAIRIGEGVVAFTGISGAGKSTLAAFLAEAGQQAFADDVCVIDTAADPPVVRSSISRLKLWSASMDALGKPKLEANRDTVRWEKYHLRLAPVTATLPLRAILLLETHDGDAPALEPVTGAGALTAVTHNVFRPEFVRSLGRSEPIFRMAGAVAGAVPVYRLCRRWDLDDMDRCVALVLERWGQA